MGPHSDIQQWMTILDYLIASSHHYKYVVPGHGLTVSDDTGLRKQKNYLKDIWQAVYKAKRKRWSLERTLERIRLEQYREYSEYDRIDLDIKRCWNQVRIQKKTNYDW